MGSTPTPRPLSPEDRWPRGGLQVSAEGDAVRYELVVRLDPRTWHLKPKQVAVIRIRADESVWLSTRDAR